MKRQQKPMETEKNLHYCCNVSFSFIFIFMRKEKIPILPFEQIVLHDLSLLMRQKTWTFVNVFHGHVKDRNAPYHALAFHHICHHQFLFWQPLSPNIYSPQLGVDGS
jgi:hypothetical protein